MYLLNDRYPIDTADQVKIAADFVEKHITKFSPGDRAIAASRLEKQASELGVFIDNDWVHNYGRFSKTASRSPEFETSLNMRRDACAGIMLKVASTDISAVEMLDHIKFAGLNGDAMRTVEAIESFDKCAGIEHLVDREFPDPVFTVFGSTMNPRFDAEKLASDVTVIDIKRAMTDSGFKEKVANIAPEYIDKLASIDSKSWGEWPAECKTIVLDAVRSK